MTVQEMINRLHNLTGGGLRSNELEIWTVDGHQLEIVSIQFADDTEHITTIDVKPAEEN